MKEKVAKSMTIEKNVALDLKEETCAELNFLFNFLHYKKRFLYKVSYFLSSYFLQCTWSVWPILKQKVTAESSVDIQ